MNNNQVAKEMIDGNKALLDATFTNLAALQDRTNNQIANVLEITPCISREAKKAPLILRPATRKAIKKFLIILSKQKMN